MKKFVALTFGLMAMGTVSMAQTNVGKWGPDSVKTIENASIYTELVKQKNYKEALPHWRYVFINAPKLQTNTYVRGEEIMTHLYVQTKNKAYYDTLMLVFDKRIEHFGDHPKYDEGYILGKKGTAMLRFADTPEDLKAAYNVLCKSAELRGPRVDPPVVQNLFRAGCELLSKNLMTREEVISLYTKCSKMAETGGTRNGKIGEAFKDTKEKVDAMFYDAGIADRTTLETLLTERYNANKGDVATMKDILSLLKRSEFEDVPLYATVAEELYKVEPSAESAASLAMMFGKRKDFDKMEQYLLEAISKSESEEDKAGYYMTLSKFMLAKGQGSSAKKYAYEVLKRNPKSGEAYIMIGRAYAAYSKSYGEDDFEHRSVFWAAVDKFNQAKSVDPSVASEANELIATYSQHFPTKEEGFFRGIHANSEVKIGAWINETTKARFNN